ncbi:MAG: hypothetical protein HQL21_06610 [Candidatus Omnitrophica bacterium]|nr:hypothetical protein [Candidatus Omnitrophota bacterium]
MFAQKEGKDSETENPAVKSDRKGNIPQRLVKCVEVEFAKIWFPGCTGRTFLPNIFYEGTARYAGEENQDPVVQVVEVREFFEGMLPGDAADVVMNKEAVYEIIREEIDHDENADRKKKDKGPGEGQPFLFGDKEEKIGTQDRSREKVIRLGVIARDRQQDAYEKASVGVILFPGNENSQKKECEPKWCGIDASRRGSGIELASVKEDDRKGIEQKRDRECPHHGKEDPAAGEDEETRDKSMNKESRPKDLGKRERDGGEADPVIIGVCRLGLKGIGIHPAQEGIGRCHDDAFSIFVGIGIADKGVMVGGKLNKEEGQKKAEDDFAQMA